MSRPKWVPGLGVEEDEVEDVGGQGDGEDGVQQVDLFHYSQLRETVLLYKLFFFYHDINLI